jgi:hypothetical protein
VTASGDRTVTRQYDVAAGQSTVFTMSGLPLGTVVFSAAAFADSCSDVTTAREATNTSVFTESNLIPDWVSDPVVASVAVSPAVGVTLVMHRNGNAGVSVDFPNEPADGGPPDGSPIPCSGTGPSDVDQSQLLGDTGFVVSATQSFAQTFVAGVSGFLTGIEIHASNCSEPVSSPSDPTAGLTLTVLSAGLSVGSATIPFASLTCNGLLTPLSAWSTGPGLFDLTSQCIFVTAGQPLTFVVTYNSLCRACSTGLALVAAKNGNPYPLGEELTNGSPAPGNSLAFKTFVRQF